MTRRAAPRGDAAHGDVDREMAALFRSEWGRLFSVAYRMLGTVSEAEDVVQEAFARYQRVDRSGIASPQAFLTTIVTRIAIDQLRASRAQREHYVGSWLPEPLVDDPAAIDRIELADSLSMAFLVLLETLSPVERAVFVLHEVFDYRYDEIAPIVSRRAEHCRQIALRARRHVEARRPRFETSHSHRDELARRFFAACQEGETGALVELLTEDCVLYGDGGGRAPAVAKPLHGAERVARALSGFIRVGREIGARVEPASVNGQPGARFVGPDGRLINVVALDIGDDGIYAVRSIVNPDKLSHLGPVADVRALLATRAGRRRRDAH